jgi:hypothetical protein
LIFLFPVRADYLSAGPLHGIEMYWKWKWREPDSDDYTAPLATGLEEDGENDAR